MDFGSPPRSRRDKSAFSIACRETWLLDQLDRHRPMSFSELTSIRESNSWQLYSVSPEDAFSKRLATIAMHESALLL